MVQVSLSKDKAEANKVISQLRAKGYRVTVRPTDKGTRIMVGPHKDKSAAETTRKKIASDSGLGINGAWVNGWVPLEHRK